MPVQPPNQGAMDAYSGPRTTPATPPSNLWDAVNKRWTDAAINHKTQAWTPLAQQYFQNLWQSENPGKNPNDPPILGAPNSNQYLPSQTQPPAVNPTPGTITNPVSTQPGSVPQSTPDTNWFQNYMNRINYGFNFNYPNFANQSQDMGF